VANPIGMFRLSKTPLIPQLEPAFKRDVRFDELA